MALTGNDVAAALRAAGASTSGLVASTDKIAELFNDAMINYGVCSYFNDKNDVAALVSECMMESAYFRTTVEYSNTGPYQPYRGRTFIQLTWDTNYRGFGTWCKKQGLVSDPNYFVNNPTKLGELRWAALGGVYYFTQVMFHGKPLTDYSHNIAQVGKAVNLGDPYSSAAPNGEKAREDAYRAVMGSTSNIVPDCSGSTLPDGTTTPDGQADQEEDDMAKAEHVKMHRQTDQPIEKADANTYQWLYLDEDDHVSVATSPSKITGLLYVEIAGLTPADTVNIYAGSYDVRKQTGPNPWTPVTENNPDRITGEANGWVHRSIPVIWSLGDQAKGWDYRALRFMIASNTTKAVIKNVRFEGWVTPK